VIAGLACAFVIGKALPSTMDAISFFFENDVSFLPRTNGVPSPRFTPSSAQGP
jgi:hypothetical protein